MYLVPKGSSFPYTVSSTMPGPALGKRIGPSVYAIACEPIFGGATAVVAISRIVPTSRFCEKSTDPNVQSKDSLTPLKMATRLPRMIAGYRAATTMSKSPISVGRLVLTSKATDSQTKKPARVGGSCVNCFITGRITQYPPLDKGVHGSIGHAIREAGATAICSADV